MVEYNERGWGERDLPVVSFLVDKGTPTPNRLMALFNKILHPDGRVNADAPEISQPMEVAESEDSDVVLITGGTNTVAVVGKWLAEHKELVEIGAGVTIAGLVAAGTIGFVLRKHHREIPPRKHQ